MATCKTCKHWVSIGDSDFRADMRASAVCQPVDPDTYEPMALGYEVRECKSPLLRWFATPGPNEAALVDGSEYYAALLTGEAFGCVNHESDDLPTCPIIVGGHWLQPGETIAEVLDRIAKPTP